MSTTPLARILTAAFLALALLGAHASAQTAQWVTARGTVSADTTPVCALVLINGQSTFSCGANLGTFDLEAPPDANGQLTVQVFADGFAPVRQDVPASQAGAIPVQMSRVSGGRQFQVSSTISPSSREGWAAITGSVSADNSPVCALVLANGQQMFSCDTSLGFFTLEVPLDERGEVKLQIFAAGFAPWVGVLELNAEVSLAGDVLAPVVMDTDSDTNDINAPYAPNDSCSQAREIGNPVTLGGYINEPGTGSPGRSRIRGDVDDFYRVELLAGQFVTMVVSDFISGDADLYLLDSDCRMVDASLEFGEVETLTVPSSGDYYLVVNAFSGATNYVLIVGGANTSGVAGRMRLSSTFEHERAVLRYRDQSVAPRQLSAHSVSTRSDVRVIAGRNDREMLLGLDTARNPRVSAAESNMAASFGSAGVLGKWRTLMAIKTLRDDPDVADAHPNYVYKSLGIPNDQYYGLQWHYPLINLPAAWDLEEGSPDVIVAVVDSGVLLDHPDLQGQFVDGYDFISDPSSANDGDGIDDDPSDPGNGNLFAPSDFHGTHVSGTVAARTNNNFGVAGVAPGIRIMPLRVIGSSGTIYDVLQAVRFAAGLPNDSDTVPPERADVINLSLGCEPSPCPCISQEQAVYDQVRDAGVMVVAAAGNESSPLPSSPAWCDGVISVSAVDLERKLTRYSNTGPTIDIAAPGGDIGADLDGVNGVDGVWSTLGSDASGQIAFVYSAYNGTSMAAPHVAGVLALMKSANPELTPAVIDQQLAAGNLTDDLGTPGRDNDYGHGLVNARKAVTTALNLSGEPPTADPLLEVTPGSLNFDRLTSTLEIVTRNASAGDLQLTQVSSDQPWMSVAPLSVDDNDLGRYEVSVNRDSLSDGLFSGEITVESSANDVSIPVIMTVDSSGAAGGNAGYIYVLLIDTVTGAVFEASPPLEAGEYEYTFQDVPAGTYEIAAGTDSDNDFFICDAGEACGLYTTIEQPRLIDANSDREDLDFTISFITALPATNASGDIKAPREGYSRRTASEQAPSLRERRSP